jgi:hypothetical protein
LREDFVGVQIMAHQVEGGAEIGAVDAIEREEAVEQPSSRVVERSRSLAEGDDVGLRGEPPE